MRRVRRTAIVCIVGVFGAAAVAIAAGDNPLADYVIPHEREGTQNANAAADTIAIEQIWNAYAHYLDSGDVEGVASLFTPTGGYVLGYANRTTQQVEPYGYSPSADGTSGTPGGGCTALGHDAIVNFLHGLGITQKNKFPGLGKHIVVNKWIHIHGDTATMHAYWLGGNPVMSAGLYNNTFVRTPQGWKAQRNEVIFDNNNPTRPCRN